MTAPILRPIGEHGLLVDFGDRPDAAVYRRLLELDARLDPDSVPGFAEAVPATTTLLVRFDPRVSDHGAVGRAIRRLLAAGGDRAGRSAACHRVQVCYDEAFAPDLAEVARQCAISPDAVIEAHLAGRYSVQMYGFAPGYAYLGGVPEGLHLPRKPAARRDVPAGSVLIAGAQCLVSTLTMPTGWWIIGRSPTAILTGDDTRPFLFEVGDRVRFERISRADVDRAGPV
jgi:inhibitor of KinA